MITMFAINKAAVGLEKINLSGWPMHLCLESIEETVVEGIIKILHSIACAISRATDDCHVKKPTYL